MTIGSAKKHISEVKKGNEFLIDGNYIEATSDAYMAKTDNGRGWNFESGDGYYYASDFEGGIIDIAGPPMRKAEAGFGKTYGCGDDYDGIKPDEEDDMEI